MSINSVDCVICKKSPPHHDHWKCDCGQTYSTLGIFVGTGKGRKIFDYCPSCGLPTGLSQESYANALRHGGGKRDGGRG